MNAQPLPDPVVPECSGGSCVTCSDEAVEMTVWSLLDDDLALASTALVQEETAQRETGQEEVGHERISVALVPVVVGDVVLVHAGEAIAIVKE